MCCLLWLLEKPRKFPQNSAVCLQRTSNETAKNIPVQWFRGQIILPTLPKWPMEWLLDDLTQEVCIQLWTVNRCSVHLCGYIYKSSYRNNKDTSTSQDLLIYSYIHTHVNLECLLQSRPVDSVVQSSSQLDFAGKSRTTTMEWQRENDLDHSHGSQLTRPANESFSCSRRCNWYSSWWSTIIP